MSSDKAKFEPVPTVDSDVKISFTPNTTVPSPANNELQRSVSFENTRNLLRRFNSFELRHNQNTFPNYGNVQTYNAPNQCVEVYCLFIICFIWYYIFRSFTSEDNFTGDSTCVKLLATAKDLTELYWWIIKLNCISAGIVIYDMVSTQKSKCLDAIKIGIAIVILLYGVLNIFYMFISLMAGEGCGNLTALSIIWLLISTMCTCFQCCCCCCVFVTALANPQAFRNQF
jgi:hypothetical protein